MATSNGGTRPRLLDLFCGAGGAGYGYHLAGFDVVGVDIAPQPNYPFTFIQDDALTVTGDWSDFDAIHASPPCQAHVKGLNSVNLSRGRTLASIDLIARTRELLQSTGLPYVIENVVGAPLKNPVRLCGSSFNLDVRRHRLFECSFPLLVPPCDHSRQNGDFWTSWRNPLEPGGPPVLTRRAKVAQVYGQAGERHRWPEAMGIDWMTYDELAQAIPPAYTEHIGTQLIAHLNATVAA